MMQKSVELLVNMTKDNMVCTRSSSAPPRIPWRSQLRNFQTKYLLRSMWLHKNNINLDIDEGSPNKAQLHLVRFIMMRS